MNAATSDHEAPAPGASGEEVEGAVASKELGWVEVLAGPRGDGVEDARIRKAGQGKGDAHPDGVAGSGVGVDHRVQRLSPSGRCPGVGGEDRHRVGRGGRSEEHTSELQSLMLISYAVFCLQKHKVSSQQANT